MSANPYVKQPHAKDPDLWLRHVKNLQKKRIDVSSSLLLVPKKKLLRGPSELCRSHSDPGGPLRSLRDRPETSRAQSPSRTSSGPVPLILALRTLFLFENLLIINFQIGNDYVCRRVAPFLSENRPRITFPISKCAYHMIGCSFL